MDLDRLDGLDPSIFLTAKTTKDFFKSIEEGTRLETKDAYKEHSFYKTAENEAKKECEKPLKDFYNMADYRRNRIHNFIELIGEMEAQTDAYRFLISTGELRGGYTALSSLIHKKEQSIGELKNICKNVHTNERRKSKERLYSSNICAYLKQAILEQASLIGKIYLFVLPSCLNNFDAFTNRELESLKTLNSIYVRLCKRY